MSGYERVRGSGCEYECVGSEEFKVSECQDSMCRSGSAGVIGRAGE